MPSAQSLSERQRHARFSLLPSSTAFLSFDVLEWIPSKDSASGELLALRPARGVASEHRYNSSASVASRERRVHPRDCSAFESSVGSWACFRTLSCYSDILVLEDAQSVDVGAAHRHEYTWQQGPSCLPLEGEVNASFGASTDHRPMPASVSHNATHIGTDIVPREALLTTRRLGRPAHGQHHPTHEIPMRDVHSVRRHSFQTPISLLFDARGHLISERESSDTAARSDRAKWLVPRRRHHRNGSSPKVSSLQWRYELWGPVGVTFTLRGGRRIFLAFASAQHAEQIEKLLIRFATGAKLIREEQRCHFNQRNNTDASASVLQMPARSADDDMPYAASAGEVFVAPLSPGVLQRTSLQSFTSEREASLHKAPATPPSPRVDTASPSTWAFAAHSLVSSTPAGLPPQTVVFARGNSLLGLSGTATASHEVGCAPAWETRCGSSKPPGRGYLYCRPWGEASRYRRYYLKMSTTAGMSHIAHLSRHRLRLWQRLQQAFGNDKHSVWLDLRRTSVSPSTTHENLLLLAPQVESFTQHKNVELLGSGVTLVGPASKSSAARAARRREPELCTGRPVVFEALAKSPEERTLWLAWFCSHGATVPTPVSDVQMGDSADVLPTPEASAVFRQLGGTELFTTSPAIGAEQNAFLSNTADRWVSSWETSTLSVETFPSAKPLGIGTPRLPLKEPSEGQRGGLRAPAEAIAAPRLSPPFPEDLSKASSFLRKSLLASGKHVSRRAHVQPPPALAFSTGDRKGSEAELSIVVEDDDLDKVALYPETAVPHSAGRLMRSDSATVDHVVAPLCRTPAPPLLAEAARWPRSSSERAAEAPNIIAVAEEKPKTGHTVTSNGPSAAPMYLEDTASSELSSPERSDESPPQLLATTEKSPRPSSSISTPQDGSNSPKQYNKSETHRGHSETPLEPTEAAQRATCTASSTVALVTSQPSRPATTTDGGATPAPLKASLTVAASTSFPAEQYQDRSGCLNSGSTPPRTVKPEAAFFTATSVEVSFTTLSQQMRPTSNRISSTGAQPSAAPPAALRRTMEKPTGTSSSGRMDHQLCDESVISGLRHGARVIQDTSTSSSPAPSSRESLVKGDGDTHDARVSEMSSLSPLAPERGLLPSSSSVVDLRLLQFLEARVSETSDDQAGSCRGSCRRGGGTPIRLASTPFDLHVVPSS
uniref:Uncharacterized protein n=1 Tax=Leishmania guyanensis TaxID=5670 RepID=A0A1E1J1X0_LEIGU|nr:hypothetical protein, unknown function [Leishmania guyanensis]